jgi:hypothetical protein
MQAYRTILLTCASLLLLASGVANAQSHSYINYMRSSINTNVFVQQSVDGEYGKYSASGRAKNAAGVEEGFTDDQFWKGYGIGTTAGLEIMKFIQFVAGHTFVNMRHKDDALESLNGSRLHAGARLSFLSPVANLELGAGVQGSRLDYQKQLDNGSFYGSGTYYSLGLNYFVSSKVSFYYEAKMAREHLVRNGGSAAANAFDTDSTMMGLGFRIWM